MKSIIKKSLLTSLITSIVIFTTFYLLLVKDAEDIILLDIGLRVSIYMTILFAVISFLFTYDIFKKELEKKEFIKSVNDMLDEIFTHIKNEKNITSSTDSVNVFYTFITNYKLSLNDEKVKDIHLYILENINL